MAVQTQHMRPSFFIIGANKCGTSSLYRYLLANPRVLPCAKKEPNFFGRHSADYIADHIDEYFSLFPTCDYRGPLSFVWEASDEAGTSNPTTIVIPRRPDSHYITGEASANTFHDVAPLLLHRYLPETNLIILLRNPVDRAYSHHRMYQRFRDAGHDLGMEVSDFATDIRAEMAAHEQGERTEYLGPGIYVELLRGWIATYGENRVKVFFTEDLARLRTARQIMLELENHLGLPRHDYADILTRRFNHAKPASMDPATRSALVAFYRPHNARLQEYLGRESHWD
ncbi:MAG TPA: sulfotransferase [Pseudonocardiaceae bacterium]|nr:sulfotransferase [Pseudonocardiaceae bacterium]